MTRSTYVKRQAKKERKEILLVIIGFLLVAPFLFGIAFVIGDTLAKAH